MRQVSSLPACPHLSSAIACRDGRGGGSWEEKSGIADKSSGAWPTVRGPRRDRRRGRRTRPRAVHYGQPAGKRGKDCRSSDTTRPRGRDSRESSAPTARRSARQAVSQPGVARAAAPGIRAVPISVWVSRCRPLPVPLWQIRLDSGAGPHRWLVQTGCRARAPARILAPKTTPGATDRDARTRWGAASLALPNETGAGRRTEFR